MNSNCHGNHITHCVLLCNLNTNLIAIILSAAALVLVASAGVNALVSPGSSPVGSSRFLMKFGLILPDGKSLFIFTLRTIDENSLG